MLSKVKNELKQLFIEGDLLIISLSVYLGFVLQKFLESLVRNIFYPILSSLIPKDAFIHFKINDKTVDIGDVIRNLINLILGLFISYVIIRILLKYLD